MHKSLAGPVNFAPISYVGQLGEDATIHFRYMQPDELEATIRNLGLDVSIGAPLKGGKVSQVFAATMHGDTPVVVKYTHDTRSDDPTELFLPHASHYVDAHLLEVLSGAEGVRVPHVLRVFDEIPITVTEDLRTDGYQLVHEQVIKRALPPMQHAADVGRQLRRMVSVFATAGHFSTALSPEILYFDRALESKELLPNTRFYFDLRERFLSEDHRQLIPVDTHIKNIFGSQGGSAAFIDFGFSVWGDPQFVLPNTMAHYVLYSLAGYVSQEATAAYLGAMIDAYCESDRIDERVAVQYLAMEVLHRAFGKRIAGIDTWTQQRRILEFGLQVVHHPEWGIEAVLESLASWR